MEPQSRRCLLCFWKARLVDRIRFIRSSICVKSTVNETMIFRVRKLNQSLEVVKSWWASAQIEYLWTSRFCKPGKMREMFWFPRILGLLRVSRLLWMYRLACAQVYCNSLVFGLLIPSWINHDLRLGVSKVNNDWFSYVNNGFLLTAFLLRININWFLPCWHWNLLFGYDNWLIHGLIDITRHWRE